MKLRMLLLLPCILILGACAGVRPADIYPQMPPNSSFTRKITTIWGQTEVTYKTGPQAPAP